jgi:hypothetical protein
VLLLAAHCAAATFVAAAAATFVAAVMLLAAACCTAPLHIQIYIEPINIYKCRNKTKKLQCIQILLFSLKIPLLSQSLSSS